LVAVLLFCKNSVGGYVLSLAQSSSCIGVLMCGLCIRQYCQCHWSQSWSSL